MVLRKGNNTGALWFLLYEERISQAPLTDWVCLSLSIGIIRLRIFLNIQILQTCQLKQEGHHSLDHLNCLKMIILWFAKLTSSRSLKRKGKK